MTTDKALTVRSVSLGLLLSAIFAALAPLNDALLLNTYLYSQHLPVGVFFLLVLIGIVFNPLLGRFRLGANELKVIIGMLLVLGGVVGAGLNANFPPVVAGPAKLMVTTSDLSAYVGDAGEIHLPKEAYIGLPEAGRPDGNDPEYRYLIDGYHHGLGSDTGMVKHRSRVTWRDERGGETTRLAWAGGHGGSEVLDLDRGDGRLFLGQRAGAEIATAAGTVTITAVEAPGIPWKTWLDALWTWAPLLGATMLAFICMAALVRHQWMHNERLTYPIAEVICGFLSNPEPGHRLAPIFRNRIFWIAFIVVGIVLVSNGLYKLGYIPFAIPTTINLKSSFDISPIKDGFASASSYLNPVIYFSIVGLVFFLPADMSLSVWLCFVGGNAIYALLKHQGVPVVPSMATQVSMGGWFVECALILWIGRKYYWSLLRTLVGPCTEPHLREVRPFSWAFLASALGMVLAMVAFGAIWYQAIIAMLVYLGTGLVMARLVAEAGIPFIQMPLYCSTVILSLTGVSAPIAALVPLTMLGQTLCSDGREHVLPFASSAEYLASKAEVPRLSWGAIAVVVLAIGTVISGAVMLWCAYAHNGQQAIDGWWRHGPVMGNFGPIAREAEGGQAIDQVGIFTNYGIGAVATAGLGIARLAWSWWPVHPIGLLVCATYPISKIWFSFFLGWLVKVLVMRYGGVELYKRLKPAAMGLIASEAFIAGLFLIIGLIAGLYDIRLPGRVRFLPD